MAGEALIGVDASVVVKWFRTEVHSEDALRLRDDYISRNIDVASVELLPFEVLNALRYNPSVDADTLMRISRTMRSYGLWLHPLDGEFADRTVENSLKHNITIYDSSYLSLGETMGIPVYTADQKLIEKVGGQTIWHVSDYKTR